MRSLLLVLLGVMAGPLASSAQDFPTRLPTKIAAIPQAELDAITERGRQIVEYDAAAWRATDMVVALKPAMDRVRGYLARKLADGRWEVVFGRPSDDGAAFLVAYRVVVGADANSSETITFDPPRADREYFVRAGRALDLGRRTLGAVNRPYNAAVLPVIGSDEWWVYLLPAQTQSKVFPHGGDVRYRVSADGRSLVEQRRLHNTILEFGPPPQGELPEAGMHTAVVADRPEDTDVFYVLTRTPRLPEYIASDSYYFRVALDGKITAYDRDRR